MLQDPIINSSQLSWQFTFNAIQTFRPWAVVVAQLVESLLPIPEICGSNPVIGNIFTNSCIKKLRWQDEHKEKRGREWLNFVIKKFPSLFWFLWNSLFQKYANKETLCPTISRYLLSMGQDLAIFCHFGKIVKVFGHLMTVYSEFENDSNLLWQCFYSLGTFI